MRYCRQHRLYSPCHVHMERGENKFLQKYAGKIPIPLAKKFLVTQIPSGYCVKVIFNFVETRRKMQLVKYNTTIYLCIKIY